ncbi:MAG TPA: hypothetical protein VLF59_02155 [Candidatus Saccharimonadales bacterium]|nr:hypothetical protein [Candidatus Saccharimonadales bacterium]
MPADINVADTEAVSEQDHAHPVPEAIADNPQSVSEAFEDDNATEDV